MKVLLKTTSEAYFSSVKTVTVQRTHRTYSFLPLPPVEELVISKQPMVDKF